MFSVKTRKYRVIEVKDIYFRHNGIRVLFSIGFNEILMTCSIKNGEFEIKFDEYDHLLVDHEFRIILIHTHSLLHAMYKDKDILLELAKDYGSDFTIDNKGYINIGKKVYNRLARLYKNTKNPFAGYLYNEYKNIKGVYYNIFMLNLGKKVVKHCNMLNGA